MNKLQNQTFEITIDTLKYIKDREKDFIYNNYLLPVYLIDKNIASLYKKIRESHRVDKDTFQKYQDQQINDTVNKASKTLQRLVKHS